MLRFHVPLSATSCPRVSDVRWPRFPQCMVQARAPPYTYVRSQKSTRWRVLVNRTCGGLWLNALRSHPWTLARWRLLRLSRPCQRPTLIRRLRASPHPNPSPSPTMKRSSSCRSSSIPNPILSSSPSPRSWGNSSTGRSQGVGGADSALGSTQRPGRTHRAIGGVPLRGAVSRARCIGRPSVEQGRLECRIGQLRRARGPRHVLALVLALKREVAGLQASLAELLGGPAPLEARRGGESGRVRARRDTPAAACDRAMRRTRSASLARAGAGTTTGRSLWVSRVCVISRFFFFFPRALCAASPAGCRRARLSRVSRKKGGHPREGRQGGASGKGRPAPRRAPRGRAVRRALPCASRRTRARGGGSRQCKP